MRSMNGWVSTPTDTGATARRNRPARPRRIGRIAAVAVTAMLASTLAPGALTPASADVGLAPTLVNGIPAFFEDGNVKLKLGPDIVEPGVPTENFWFSAEATNQDANGDGGNLEVYVAGIESAGAGTAFSRLRIRVVNLVEGATYTVQHPYGVNTLVAGAGAGGGGARSINFTEDLGCLEACTNFDATAAGFIGDFKANTTTFLKQTGALPGTLGSPLVPAPVTGAPSGVNAVIVTGPNAGGQGVDTLTVTDFAIQGDILVPDAGTPSMPKLVSDTGRSITDNITNATLPTFTGTVQGAGAGVAVNVTVDSLPPISAVTTADGAYTVTLAAALAQGPHSVVAASGPLSSSRLRFTEDTTAPVVTLAALRPANNTIDRTPTFTFSKDEADATFACRLSPSTVFAPCTSPMTFGTQTDGDHTFTLQATDAAGNVSVPASHSWMIGSRLSDFNIDGLTDMVARDKAGTLWLYPGNGSGGFLTRKSMGGGWNSITAIITPGDVNGDGKGDILARNRAGQLWFYPGNGASALSTRRLAGASGWNSMNAITAAGNMIGNARPDMLARDSAGRLWLYPSTGSGTFGTRRLAGASGWNAMSAFSGAGDLSGDGRADLLARDGAGNLWLYRGNGVGSFGARTPAGRGWNGMTALVTPGNVNLVSGNDLIARDGAGRLWLYPGSNAGLFGTRRPLGHGFNGYTLA